MRIVIDMQGAQASNRRRGIGRYVMSLTEALLRLRGEHHIMLALNGALVDTIEPIRAAFAHLLDQADIRVWQGVADVPGIAEAAGWRRGAAELVRETFIAGLAPDIVLVSSLFEGLGDDAVTSIGALGRALPTAVILYDLIPLIHRQPYLDNPAIESWYEAKLGHLQRADLLLAISESSRQEALAFLGTPAGQCVTISTAADSHFTAGAVPAETAAALRQRYGLRGEFLMYTGGIDHRKNVEGLISAYATLAPRLRNSHQLAIVCSVEPSARQALVTLARRLGLAPHEIVLTGYVPEEDLIALYRLCTAFVFPSWHEGFGLPALEAMSCGRAVIAARGSSLPEVIGRDDALFDPRDETDMAAKIAKVLEEAPFRAELERYGLERAKTFSWDSSARRTLAALQDWHSRAHQPASAPSSSPLPAPVRPRLAYVSPLPPARSGISDYSAELLPELARHYTIDVIVAQDQVSTPWIRANCKVRTPDYLRQHASSYDRVLYHFGNSDFHQHMFGLLDEVPGVVVLHDFFLSGICAHMEVTGYRPGYWARALYESHGYAAARERFHVADTADVVWAYPCNLPILQRARQVIVHSENSRNLARRWYGAEAGQRWPVIPHLRVAELQPDRRGARAALGLDEHDVVVCSFGMLGPSKLNHRLLEAFLASPLAADPRCVLVFVGENPAGAYGTALTAAIAQSKLGKRIRITGWTDTAVFRQWLAAADIGVQLRTLSRGETSGTVLDCMNYGIATIVNANGSMADLSEDGVCKLPDEFADQQLIDALTTLWRDPTARAALSRRAIDIILDQHAPRHCGDQYAAAIEAAYASGPCETQLLDAIAALDHPPADDAPWLAVAAAAAQALPLRPARRQLLVDISELVQRDARSGIQRVVRSILRELLLNPPAGYAVEPVYAALDHGYRYARRYTLGILDCPGVLEDAAIEARAGDVFLGLDLQPHVVAARRDDYRTLRAHGVAVHFVVYDLLPIVLPSAFPHGAAEHHSEWLDVVAASDGALCISQAVATELQHWLVQRKVERARPLQVETFKLGADIAASVPTTGMPDDASAVIQQLRAAPSFLMVGTLEPRKAHGQVLAAFELLWEAGCKAQLVIVGKQGWLVDTLAKRLRGHPELGQQLFWLESISDQYLHEVFGACAALVAASHGEGFGLPLIEAAQQGLPIIARNIPVFVEVAGEHAFYFDGSEPGDLAQALQQWLRLHGEGKAPGSQALPWSTWSQSTASLVSKLHLLP